MLRLLRRGLPCDVAVIGSLRGDRLLVEEGWPPDGIAGKRLRLPIGLLGDAPVLIDTATIRLPLDWTETCGGRPAFIAAAPVDPGATYLVVAGRAETMPDLTELAEAAAAIGRLLGAGQMLQRDRDMSARIHALIDHLAIPVLFVDSRLAEMFLNDPARGLLGVGMDAQHAEIAAAVRALVASAGEGLAERLLADLRSDLSLGLSHQGGHYAVESRWIEQGPLAGRLWTFRDVTNEREAARFKDELVANVSHELRTPLTSITGALALLRSGAVGAVPEKAAALLDIAHNNAERLGRLVNDLLMIGSLEADRLEMKLVATDLAGLLAEAVALHRPYADTFGVRVVLDVPQHLVQALVDADRLVQVMGNLLSNAAKFSREGGQVTVALVEEGERVRVSVIDRGLGMTPQFQTKLFSRFTQEQGYMSGRSGTGLGLAISKGIVERLGGTISVESEVDVGSAFHIHLPTLR